MCTAGIEIASALLEYLNLGCQFGVLVVEVDDLFTVQPMLNDRSFANNAARVPLPNWLGVVSRGWHTKVE